MSQKQKILIIDDEPDVRNVLATFLGKIDYEVHHAEIGIDGIEMLAKERFDLVLCDVMMPALDGLSTLALIKKTHPKQPVIMMSGFATHDKIIEALDKGAVDMLAKPFNFTQIRQVVTKVLNPRLRYKPEYNSATSHLLRESYMGLLRIIIQLTETKNKYLKNHCSRVAEYSSLIAKAMRLRDDTVEVINCAGLMHDIGKISLSDLILMKEGKLTPQEWADVKMHPVIGSMMMEQLKLFRAEEPLIRHHHERFDGQGYPSGLAGDKIPIGARIIAVADTYDAMTSIRPYREALTPHIALNTIRQNSGSQFDPKVVAAFLEVVKKEQASG
ncbi:MAG: HD domain-containing phosphohydrolase [Candidatus Brocadiia bacterium]